LTMTPAELEQKFAEALRRALGTTEAGAPVVHVAAAAAPVVNISPVVEAMLPMPSEPVEVIDIGRQNGAYEFRMRVSRNAQGQITDAVVSPEKFIPLESFT
jgi:hypothetical protein